MKESEIKKKELFDRYLELVACRCKKDEKIKDEFQIFLSRNLLSSHMMVISRKNEK